MKIAKILGFVVLAIVVVVAAAVGLFAYTFDPNDYKAEIVKQVRNETGRELTIEGDISLSFFPWLGFSLGKTGLSDDPAFADEPFATVTAVDVRVRVEPLLRRRIEAGTILIDGLTLNLIRDEGGRGNWETLNSDTKSSAGTASDSTQGSDAATAGAASGEAPAIAGFAVGGLTLTNATVTYADRQSNQNFAIRDMNLETGEIDLQQPIELKAGLKFDSDQPPMAATLDLSSVALLDLTQQQYSASDTKLNLVLSGDGLPDGGLETTIEFAASVDLAKQLAKVEPLRISVWNVGLEGSVEGQQILDQPTFRGSMSIAEFSPKELLAAVGASVPETSDPGVLSVAAFKADFEATPDAARFPKLALNLDQTLVQGSASLVDFSNPAIEFDLAADKIDLDRYLPPADEDGDTAAKRGDAERASAGGAQESGAEALPLETLRSLNLKGLARIREFKINKLRATNAELRINASEGVLKLNPLKLDLYEGRARGAASLDVTGEMPRIRSQLEVSGVQAEPLLRDLAGEALISGKGRVQADVTAKGDSAAAIKKTLNGTAGLVFKNGAVNGVNVAKIIREARARLKGQPIPQDSEPNKTDFTELSATATITNGVVKNDDLALKSPLLRIAGEGSASLPAETLDYRVDATVVGSLKGEGGRSTDELKGVTVPVKVAGTFSDPEIGPDMEALAKEGARELADKHKDKATKKARDTLQKKLGKDAGGKLGDQLDGALDSLLK